MKLKTKHKLEASLYSIFIPEMMRRELLGARDMFERSNEIPHQARFLAVYLGVRVLSGPIIATTIEHNLFTK